MKLIPAILVAALACGCVGVPKLPPDPAREAKLDSYRSRCVAKTDGARALIGGTWCESGVVLQKYRASGLLEAASLEAQAASQTAQALDSFFWPAIVGSGLALAGGGATILATPQDQRDSSGIAFIIVAEFMACELIGIVAGAVKHAMHSSKAQALGENAAKAFNRHLSDELGLNQVPVPAVNEMGWP